MAQKKETITQEEAALLASTSGFTHWGSFPVSGLRFRPEVREMCAADKCARYGKTWSCPPACGALEEAREMAAGFTWGILLQTTAELEDDFDVETMMDAERRQKERLDAFVDALGAQVPRLVMSAGTCTRCDTCTYPDAPCRFPQKLFVSMEAYGLVVSEVCASADIPYYYGPGTITYSSCVLFK